MNTQMRGRRTGQIASYQDLDVWHKSMALVEEIYRVSRSFPADEKFGLTSQIRRAAVSIPSNIAEGYGRRNRGDYRHHLSIANGSLKEVETQILIALRLYYVSSEAIIPTQDLTKAVGQMLHRLIQAL